VAEASDSGDKFHRPGGTICRGTKGEKERRTRGFIGGVGIGQLVLGDGAGVTPAGGFQWRSNAGEEHADRWAPPVSGEKEKKGNRKGKVNGSGVFGWAARVGPDRLVRSDFFPFPFFFFFFLLFFSVFFNPL
jgi:hypothetical protein